MRIEILGTESLGVRGLSCIVEVRGRKILIDPGVALGYTRHGLLPHPLQVAVGVTVRQKILATFTDATDIVLSHFHGDHVPLIDANPYQLAAQDAATVCRDRGQSLRFWAKGPLGLSRNMKSRISALHGLLDCEFMIAEELNDGCLSFSPSVPHGCRGEGGGMVMMTKIADGEDVFVHASDIQLLDEEAVTRVLAWQPTVVFASGPPLYLPHLTQRQRKLAWVNAVRLAHEIDTLILDHHVMRSKAGERWLDKLAAMTEHRVCCAADFMGRHRMLLEAWRQRLYAEMPVPEGWHTAYARGEVDTSRYGDWLPRVELW
jgi:predicted metallo-beta-lactamase superfamily hydrolase